MIVRVAPTGPPAVEEADDLGRLSVVLPEGAAIDDIEPLGRPDPDGEHVWLDVERLRAAGAAVATLPDWAGGFEAMVTYAETKGWLDDAGTSLRAHVEHGATSP